MKALQGLSLLALLATQTLARPEQSVLRVDHASVETPRFFPSEIKARTEHAAYELWRIHYPSSINTEEEALFRAAGVEDMTGYISQMADVSPPLRRSPALADPLTAARPGYMARLCITRRYPPAFLGDTGKISELVAAEVWCAGGGRHWRFPGAVWWSRSAGRSSRG